MNIPPGVVTGGVSYIVWGGILFVIVNGKVEIDMSDEQITAALIGGLGAIFGGVISSIVSHEISKSREINNFTTSIILEFLKKTNEIGYVFGLLENRSHFDEEKVNGNKAKRKCEINYNRILALGNWFDICCCFYINDEVNKTMINNTQLLNRCCDLIEAARTSNYMDEELNDTWPNIVKVFSENGGKND